MKKTLMAVLFVLALLQHASAQAAGKESFPSVQIGNQTWMSENLNVGAFRNGDKIQEVKSSAAWVQAYNQKIPAWCYYEFKAANGKKYGKLYNWSLFQKSNFS